MLSGIGEAEALGRLDIPLVADLPGVGRNLQDHVRVFVSHFATQPVSLALMTDPGERVKYDAEKRGVWTSNLGEAGAFVKLDPSSPAPELQLVFLPRVDYPPDPNVHGFMLAPGLVATQSRGDLTLRSADPTDKPLIDPNYLAEARDMQALVDGVRLAREILAASAFDRWRGDEYLPGVDVQSDEDIQGFIRARLDNIFHPTGTCKMGGDSLAVVDERLRVHGIEGLRVADALIMPFIVNANTNAPCIMIGEKCAAMMIEDA